MSKPDKIKIGLLGLGTVGSGVYKLIEKQKDEFYNPAPMFSICAVKK
jgi:homoserine dehydrogenase